MVTTKVLLLGGHGKIALHLTKLLLAKSWHISSVIRNPAHKEEVLALGKGQPGKVDVLVESLEDMESKEDAQRILEKVDPQIVVWAAGAGGKGGPSRTKAVDEIAAKLWIGVSVASPKVRKLLLISYIGSRRLFPPWWSEEDKQAAVHVNTNVLPAYWAAKVEADEFMTASAHKRAQNGDTTFQAINLRPGTLTDLPGTGKILLSKTPARGEIPRSDVATVAMSLLERSDTRGWYDLLSGEEEVDSAIDKVVAGGPDSIEGEDLARIYASVE